MEQSTPTTAERWRLYRQAREAGTPEVEAYDRYLLPRTRISDAELLDELAHKDPTPEAS